MPSRLLLNDGTNEVNWNPVILRVLGGVVFGLSPSVRHSAPSKGNENQKCQGSEKPTHAVNPRKASNLYCSESKIRLAKPSRSSNFWRSASVLASSGNMR